MFLVLTHKYCVSEEHIVTNKIIDILKMASFRIEGGHKLRGEIIPQGAKNEALQVLCAVLLSRETITINNVPDILDVNNLIHLLMDMGVGSCLASARRSAWSVNIAGVAMALLAAGVVL